MVVADKYEFNMLVAHFMRRVIFAYTTHDVTCHSEKMTRYSLFAVFYVFQPKTMQINRCQSYRLLTLLAFVYQLLLSLHSIFYVSFR